MWNQNNCLTFKDQSSNLIRLSWVVISSHRCVFTFDEDGSPIVRVTLLNLSETYTNFLEYIRESFELRNKAIKRYTQLGTNTREIEARYIIIPDEKQSQIAIKTLESIVNTATKTLTQLVTDTKPERAWLKGTLEAWEDRGLMIISKVLKAIPDPTKTGGYIYEKVYSQQYVADPKKYIDYICKVSELDISFYELIRNGEEVIRTYIQSQSKESFRDPLDLFLKVIQETIFHHSLDGSSWDVAYVKQTTSKALNNTEKKDKLGFSKRQRTNRQSWRKFLKGRYDGSPEEQQYVNTLKEIGWGGLVILAIKDSANPNNPITHQEKKISKLWKRYIQALQDADSLYSNPIRWVNGQPVRFDRNASVAVQCGVED